MNKIYVTAVSLVLFSMLYIDSIAQKKIVADSFVLNGTIKNYQKKYIYLIKYDNEGTRLRDSAIVSNQKFIFKGIIAGYNDRVFIKEDANQMENNDSVNAVQIRLDNSIISISLVYEHFSNFKMSGCRSCDEIDAFDKKNEFLSEEIMNVNDSIKAAKSSTDSLKYTLALKRSEQADEDVTIRYVDTHLNSPIVPYLIYRHLSAGNTKKYFEKLNAQQSSSYYTAKIIGFAQRSKEIEMLGSTAFLFSSKDMNGQNFSLDSLLGRGCVLLDFWYSGCGPCARQLPALKALNKKYNSKGLTVVSISDDANENKWRTTIEKDSMQQFIHCLEKDIPSNEYVKTGYSLFSEKHYAVTGYPTYILIDKNKKIIARSDAADDERLLTKIEGALQ